MRRLRIAIVLLGVACSKGSELPGGVLARGTVEPVAVSADGRTLIHWSPQSAATVARDRSGATLRTFDDLHVPQLAPNGQYVAGIGYRQHPDLPGTLRVLSLRGGSDREVPGVDPNDTFAWSPDGSALVYTRHIDAENKVLELLPSNGDPHTLALSSGTFAFSPDARWLVVTPFSTSTTQLVPVAGGSARTLGFEAFALFSPDGSTVAWTEMLRDATGFPTYRLSITPLAGGPATILAEDAAGCSPILFTRDGRWVVFISGDSRLDIRAVPATGGNPVGLMSQAALSTRFAAFGTTGLALLGLSDGQTAADLRTFESPDAAPTVVTTGMQASGGSGFTPDGSHAFANVPATDGTLHLVLIEVATGATRDLGGRAGLASFSPDGSRLAAQIEAAWSADQLWYVGTLRIVDMSGTDVIAPPSKATVHGYWLENDRLLLETALGGSQAELSIVPVP